MDIKTKFSIGDRVWFADRAHISRPVFKCPVCNGTGKSVYTGDYPCNAAIAHGKYRCINGTMNLNTSEYRPCEAHINRINIYINQDGYYDTLVFYHDDTLQSQNDIVNDNTFATKEECQAECDRLNNQLQEDTDYAF